MKFDIYGRFVVQVEYADGRWQVWRVGACGLRRPERDLAIPPSIEASEIPGFLDDLYHELASPGSEITPLDDG